MGIPSVSRYDLTYFLACVSPFSGVFRRDAFPRVKENGWTTVGFSDMGIGITSNTIRGERNVILLFTRRIGRSRKGI